MPRVSQGAGVTYTRHPRKAAAMRCAARASALRAHCPRLAQALRSQWRWPSVSRVTHGAPAALPLTVAGGWALLALEGTAVLSPAGGERDRETMREGPPPSLGFLVTVHTLLAFGFLGWLRWHQPYKNPQATSCSPVSVYSPVKWTLTYSVL